MVERIPIEIIQKQMNTDYYQRHMTLKEVCRKYRNYTEGEIRKALGIYDLDSEGGQTWTYQWFKPALQWEWNKTCKWVHGLLERRRHAVGNR